jgi:hypothetical protein
MGYWVPNPELARDVKGFRRLLMKRGPGPSYLIREALGRMSLDANHIYISDGGHIENLGVYELIRRRCKFIISVDAEQDDDIQCPSLLEILRFVRVDLGLELDIDIKALRPDEDGQSRRSWAVGTIHYSATEKGTLLYLKSSITGREPEDLLDYRRRFTSFPHDSTADQFFDAARFEAYRALGQGVTDRAMACFAPGSAQTGWLPVVLDEGESGVQVPPG